MKCVWINTWKIRSLYRIRLLYIIPTFCIRYFRSSYTNHVSLRILFMGFELEVFQKWGDVCGGDNR